MRLALFLTTLCAATPAVADQAWDFLRVQCIRELGELQVEQFQHWDPDTHGYLKYFIGSDRPSRDWQAEFAAKHHVYEASQDRTMECQLPDNLLKVKFSSLLGRAGQTVGKLTVLDGERLIFSDVPFIASVPDIQRLRIFGYGAALIIELTLRKDGGAVQQTIEFCGSPLDAAAIAELAAKSSGMRFGCR